MRLVFHQLLKDVRQHRAMLITWFTALLVDLACNLGLFGGGGPEGAMPVDMLVSVWVTMFLYAMGVVLPVQVMLADSPARQDSFLGARPVSWRQALSGKVLFVLLLVVVPAAVQEGVYLALSGVGAGYVWRGVAGRVLLMLPVATLALAFAALWPREKVFYPALAGTVFGCVMASQLLELGVRRLEWPLARQSVSDGATLLSGLCLAGICSVVLAFLNVRFRWGTLRRCVVIGAVALPVCLLHLLCPWRVLQPAGLSGPDTTAALANASVDTWPTAVRHIAHLRTNAPDSSAQIMATIVPRLADAPAGWCCKQWQAGDTAYVTGGGRVAGSSTVWRFRPYAWRSSCHQEEVRAFADLFPDGTLFLTERPTGATYCNLGRVPLVEWQRLAAEPVRIEATLSGHLHRWAVLCELPLATGERGGDDAVEWQIRGVVPTRDGGVIVRVWAHQTALFLFGDSRTPRVSHWPGSQYEFVLYDARDGMAWLPESPPRAHFRRAVLTSHFHAATAVHFVRNRGAAVALTDWDPAGWRLVVLRREYVGEMKRDWAVDDVPLQHADVRSLRGHHRSRADLPNAEFRRRLDALARPATNASDAVWRRYTDELFALIEVAPSHTNAFRGAVAELVRERLDTVLDALPTVRSSGSWRILETIRTTVDESQKHVILSALSEHPDLVRTVVSRGWVADAQPQLQTLLTGTNQLSIDLVRAIAWLEDPGTYPRLLLELARDPRLETYEALRLLPGIEAELDRTVARIWAQGSPVVTAWEAPAALSVALRHGLAGAFSEAYRALHVQAAAGSHRAGRTGERLAQTTIMPGLRRNDRHNEGKVVAWLLQYEPGDFRFDPVRRRFVLKSGGEK